jgi:hypothetical protein
VDVTNVEAPADSVFAGIDTTIAGIPQLIGAPANTLSADLVPVQSAVERAIAAYRPFAPSDVIPSLVDGLQALRVAQSRVATLALDATTKAELDFRLTLKANDFEDALTRAAGLIVDPLADHETVAPGEALNVRCGRFTNGAPVEIGAVRLRAPRVAR